MMSRLLSAGVSVLVLASLAVAAPPATKWQTRVTSPTTGTGATIKITKTSKIAVKVIPSNVTFQVKLSGVTDAGDALVTNVGNVFQVDVVVGSSFCTLMFGFNLTDGKISQKFTVANGALSCGGGLAAGQPMAIQAARVHQAGGGMVFGVAGITAKGP